MLSLVRFSMPSCGTVCSTSGCYRTCPRIFRKERLRWWCSRSQDSVKAQTYNEQCYDIFPPALLGVFLPSFLSALHRVMFTDVRLFRRLFCYLLPLANKMEK